MSHSPSLSFSSALVANRGEIARRIIRTLRDLGIRSIAVYSDADVDAPHVREADAAVRIGPAPAAESYLDIDAVIAAARASGAEAVHPGYGFLSESVGLAEACAESGIVFIGPTVEALQIMGDKARAREHVSRSGVPVVPGFDARGLSDAEIREEAEAVGFPLLVKPSAGGVGRVWRSSSTARVFPARSVQPDASRHPPSATMRSSWSVSSADRVTSRCRCSAMRTAPSWRSASASARSSVVIRR